MHTLKQLKEKLNILRYKCDDMEIAPFMKIAYEMINDGLDCPTYEELKKLNFWREKNAD
jgi:hypothetical protein